MLQVKNLSKDYYVGDNTIHALQDINLNFPDKGFVSILGQSGSGKTTFLNIIGGLDRYTSGDIVINGKSTKTYKDKDWDSYRNHHIGFVFQSYSLIPHQTLLENVMLAPAISGLPLAERREKSIEALKSVGLENRMHQRPNQVSGGQSQRTAIARALVTNPNIILADEPTGALDSETSAQVMKILKDISKEKLVIMVTHNEIIADEYSERIIKLKDGELLSDTAPLSDEELEIEEKPRKKEASMSFATSLALSWKNLMSKKGKTFLTALAGSVGIIGIAVVLAISYGVNDYIDQVQEDTLTSYPLTIMRENIGLEAIMGEMERLSGDAEPEDYGENNAGTWEIMDYLLNLENTFAGDVNNLVDFMEFIESNESFKENTSSVFYDYGLDMNILAQDPNGETVQADIMEQISAANLRIAEDEGRDPDQVDARNNMMMQGPFGAGTTFTPLIPDENNVGISQIVKNQYVLEAGQWPENEEEVVLILNEYGELPDSVLYTLGFRTQEDLERLIIQAENDEELESSEELIYSYDELMAKEIKLLFPTDIYQYNEDTDTWENLMDTESGRDYLYSNEDIGVNLTISAIIKPNPDSSSHILEGWVGYTSELSDYAIAANRESELAQEQLNNEEIDVFSGLPFPTEENTNIDEATKASDFSEYMAEQGTETQAEYYTFISTTMLPSQLDEQVEAQKELMDDEAKDELISNVYANIVNVSMEQASAAIANLDQETYDELLTAALEANIQSTYAAQVMPTIEQLSEEERAAMLLEEDFSDEALATLYDEYMPAQVSENTYDGNLASLGLDNTEPESIYIYNADFETKDNVKAIIEDYNAAASEDDEISYTDYVDLIMSMVGTIINVITYVLIGFVALSLLVSSIMMSIVTYNSVLQRTQEIGILRALGASKRNVANVFIAETFIEGLSSGIVGIAISQLIVMIINAIIRANFDVTLRLFLTTESMVVLILLSTVLTVIAGLIPSFMASRKDPVEALRTE